MHEHHVHEHHVGIPKCSTDHGSYIMQMLRLQLLQSSVLRPYEGVERLCCDVFCVSGHDLVFRCHVTVCRAERRQIRFDLRSLAKEERNRQSAAIAEVIKGAVVLCTTLTGASHPRLRVSCFLENVLRAELWLCAWH